MLRVRARFTVQVVNCWCVASKPLHLKFDPADPNISRIKGMRKNYFSGWMMRFICIFPGMGLCCVVVAAYLRFLAG
ncbi:MAG: hypothetical protein O3A00_15535 [Planctomycetota bacterium]|nr:hypothetical protein [Planctomycetota bacterium]